MLVILGITLPWLHERETLPINKNIYCELQIIDTTSKKDFLICKELESGHKMAIIWKNNIEKSIGDTIKATVQIEGIKYSHHTVKKIINDKRIKFTAKVQEKSWDNKTRKYVENGYIIAKNSSNEIPKISIFKRINIWCTERLSTLNIPKQDIAIINGVILGNKSDINSSKRKSYQSVGISHILAISGMHIGILVIILNIIFMSRYSFFYWRLMCSIMIIILLWTYTLVVGSPVSAVRATLMFSILQLSIIRIFSPAQTINTLFATATLFILCDHTLLTDVSFQLSFIATFSILLFLPKLSAMVNIENRFLKFLVDIILVSVTAQILTTPFVLYYFGYFSFVSIFANIVASIVIFLIISLSVGYIIYNSEYIEIALEWSFKILNGAVNFLLEQPYSHIEDIGFSTLDIIIYLFLVRFLLRWNR